MEPPALCGTAIVRLASRVWSVRCQRIAVGEGPPLHRGPGDPPSREELRRRARGIVEGARDFIGGEPRMVLRVSIAPGGGSPCETAPTPGCAPAEATFRARLPATPRAAPRARFPAASRDVPCSSLRPPPRCAPCPGLHSAFCRCLSSGQSFSPSRCRASPPCRVPSAADTARAPARIRPS